MLDEINLISLLEQTRKDARLLSGKAKLTEEESLNLVKLNERISTLSLVVGEDRKKDLYLQLKDMKITDIELIKASLYTLEQILISRGLTDKETIQKSLIAVIRSFREKHNAPTS